MNCHQLRQQAKSLGLIRYSKLRKAQLHELVSKRLAKEEIRLRHLAPKFILKRLTRKRAWEWQLEELQALNGKCLEALSVIMGVPKSGTKKQKIERLWAVAEVRGAMKDFSNPSDHDEASVMAKAIATSFKGKQLKALCKKVNVFAPGSKYGMAASLLNWRKTCNTRGTQALQDLKSA